MSSRKNGSKSGSSSNSNNNSLSEAALAAHSSQGGALMQPLSFKRRRDDLFAKQPPSNDSFAMHGIVVDEYTEAPMTYDSLASIDSITGRRRMGDRKNYRCGRCNKPKKGHVCPYMMRLKKKDTTVMSEGPCFDVQIQCELNNAMTIRVLNNCSQQGLEESYRTIDVRQMRER